MLIKGTVHKHAPALSAALPTAGTKTNRKVGIHVPRRLGRKGLSCYAWTHSKSLTTQETADAINALRFLSIDGVNKAKSGHPGMPMGCAALGFVLWTEAMKYHPQNPNWPNRDRFVLSAGHGCM
eukprot:1156713-Pelagomonas_calceolata.AAC.5